MLIIPMIFGALIFGTCIFLFLLNGMTHEKVFRMCGSQRSYLAWIPVACQYEMAVLTRDEDDNNDIFGITVPNKWFKYWMVGFSLINIIPFIGALAALVFKIGCAGSCYGRLYAMVENKQLSETKGVGYVSGFIGVVAAFKFMKYLDDEPASQYNSQRYNNGSVSKPKKVNKQTQLNDFEENTEEMGYTESYENGSQGFDDGFDNAFETGFGNQQSDFGNNAQYGGFNEQPQPRPQQMSQGQPRPQARPQGQMPQGQPRPQARPQGQMPQGQPRPQARPQARPVPQPNSDFETF